MREAATERSDRDASLSRVALMEQFAAALYRCLLLREPTPTGLANAINNLYAGRVDLGSAAERKEFMRAVERTQGEIAAVREMLAQEAAAQTAQLSQIEELMREKLASVDAQHERMCGTLEALTNGIQTWLLPILEKHSAAIQRRRYTRFGAPARLAKLLRLR